MVIRENGLIIQNLKTSVHVLRSFADGIRMEQLLSVLSGKVKRAVTSIGRNDNFYAATLMN